MGIQAAILVVVAAGTAASINQQKKASAAAKDARDIQEKTGRIAAAESRRQEVRGLRIRQAKMEQAAINTGVSGSSGEIGAMSSMATQVGSNSAFQTGQAVANSSITERMQQSANYSARANTWAAATSLATAAAGSSIFDTEAPNAQSPNTVQDIPQP